MIRQWPAFHQQKFLDGATMGPAWQDLFSGQRPTPADIYQDQRRLASSHRLLLQLLTRLSPSGWPTKWECLCELLGQA